MLTLKDTINYYVYSHLQALQDYRDELEELQEARKDTTLSAEDKAEIDFLIALAYESIQTVKHLAN